MSSSVLYSFAADNIHDSLSVTAPGSYSRTHT
jgi:hypothetical protein